jgi:hypothetical protein
VPGSTPSESHFSHAPSNAAAWIARALAMPVATHEIVRRDVALVEEGGQHLRLGVARPTAAR